MCADEPGSRCRCGSGATGVCAALVQIWRGEPFWSWCRCGGKKGSPSADAARGGAVPAQMRPGSPWSWRRRGTAASVVSPWQHLLSLVTPPCSIRQRWAQSCCMQLWQRRGYIEIHKHNHTHTHTRTRTHPHTHRHAHARTGAKRNTDAHTRTHTHTHAHTGTHAHTQTCKRTRACSGAQKKQTHRHTIYETDRQTTRKRARTHPHALSHRIGKHKQRDGKAGRQAGRQALADTHAHTHARRRVRIHTRTETHTSAAEHTCPQTGTRFLRPRIAFIGLNPLSSLSNVPLCQLLSSKSSV